MTVKDETLERLETEMADRKLTLDQVTKVRDLKNERIARLEREIAEYAEAIALFGPPPAPKELKVGDRVKIIAPWSGFKGLTFEIEATEGSGDSRQHWMKKMNAGMPQAGYMRDELEFVS